MRIVGEGIYAFDEEGVVVQISNANFIPRQLPLEFSIEMWKQEFRPLRRVINLEFIDTTKNSERLAKSNELNSESTTNSTPVTVTVDVYYTHAEKTSLGEGDFKLAYWDSESRKWELLNYEDHTPILSPGWAGFLRVNHEFPGDPTIALGS